MTKRAPITVGELTFASKAEALRFYKAILDKYNPGEKLNGPDFNSVLDLTRLQWDPQGESDISAIVVDYHPAHNETKCYLIEIDGSLHLFSYMLSINGSMSHMRIFSRACRYAVSGRLRKFKMEIFKNKPVRCALTNDIVKWENCHVDHKSPLTFSVIVKSFIVANNIDLQNIEYKFDNLIDEFANEEISIKFREFHERMAVLRILSKGANAKLSASARITPSKKDTDLSSINTA